ncbi:hypothetical protein SAMN05421819_3331 [Bryocella elongata]|uniref:Glycosyl hydrolase family 20, domain 2 n=1 Tax=Bryocella elongata TaxID=863522 RepID=A0A1H6AWM0_9BACT|nr:hypothetical protein [Bryocella elongata]SEG53023.1 hypothetical protein SAMN05421819_3331 [Bryocella elongata]
MKLCIPRATACLVLAALALPAFGRPRVITGTDATPRERFAAERIRTAVAGLPGAERILVAQRTDALLKPYDKDLNQFWPDAKEAFLLKRLGSTIVVSGYDSSGTLYGALELAQRISEAQALPASLDFEDHPQLKLRATAIGIQKPEITYEGAEYDYPLTQKDFGWFYDKAWWTRYLDTLVNERYNALYLWNGHPFTSLLKLPKYPEAQELPTAQLDQNIAMFQWVTAEADKRGIWVLQGFYNIHLSHTFARAHGVPYHLSAPSPLSAEYTRYCLSEFIRTYPNVGIFMTLGEAMGPHYGPQWMTDAIIPGVKDGLAELEKEVGHPVTPPPIVVRAHATDIDKVMEVSNPLYPNIDTMFKWNGESLTWTNVRGPVRAQFERLVASSQITVANIHLLSNLEPFRWGDPDFVRQTVLNFERIGIGGMHIYPLRYWDWPVSGDNTTPLLDQTDRDWIWFASWGRYAWNPHLDPKKEHVYWAHQIGDRFGSNDAGEHLLNAFEDAGPCAPALLPRIGVTEGNRQVFSLGMTMPQLIDAARYGPAQTLWTGDAPDGERLDEYVANEVNHKPHHGQTPLGIADQAVDWSTKAVTEAEAAGPSVTKDRAEYERILNDLRSIHALMLYYQAKTKAAEQVMFFGYDHDGAHLKAAETLLSTSVDHFRELVKLADPAYRSVAGMQTSQRQIPVRGAANTNHFRDLLPVYERELETFRERMKMATGDGDAQAMAVEQNIKPLPQVAFTLAPGAGETFTVNKDAGLLNMTGSPAIADLAPELAGLKGIRVDPKQDAPLHFTLSKPAQVLVALLPNKRGTANLSSATEQWNILLPGAIVPGGTGSRAVPLTVWAKPMAAGENDLDLGQGTYVVLGFIPEDAHVTPHMSMNLKGSNGAPPNLDWLFE